MTIQQTKTVKVINAQGREIDATIPEKGMLIQNIIRLKIEDSILPSYQSVAKEIDLIKSQGLQPHIILLAPIKEKPVNTSLAFDGAVDDGHKYLVTTANNLRRAGLGDFARVRRDAVAIRKEHEIPRRQIA